MRYSIQSMRDLYISIYILLISIGCNAMGSKQNKLRINFCLPGWAYPRAFLFLRHPIVHPRRHRSFVSSTTFRLVFYYLQAQATTRVLWLYRWFPSGPRPGPPGESSWYWPFAGWPMVLVWGQGHWVPPWALPMATPTNNTCFRIRWRLPRSLWRFPLWSGMSRRHHRPRRWRSCRCGQRCFLSVSGQSFE